MVVGRFSKAIPEALALLDGEESEAIGVRALLEAGVVNVFQERGQLVASLPSQIVLAQRIVLE